MHVDKKIVELVTTMVVCHDKGDFDGLKSLMDSSAIEGKDTFFTQKRFNEVRKQIHEELGRFEQLEYLGSLTKVNSLHTVWKARYSNTRDEIMWQARVSLDKDVPKIIRMSVN